MKSEEDREDPSVTLILATNRQSPFLEQALKSFRDQTYTNWELVVVDDGAVAESYIRSRLIGLPNARYMSIPSMGVSAARNAGARDSVSEYLAFPDDDDIWAPEKLAYQIDRLRADATLGGCVTAGHHIDGQGISIGTPWSAPSFSREEMLAGEVDIPRFGTLIIRNSEYKSIGGFRTDLRLSEDSDLMLKLIRQTNIAFVDRDLFSYRRHDHNSSSASVADIWSATYRYLTWHRSDAIARGRHEDAALIEQRMLRERVFCAGQGILALASALRKRQGRVAFNHAIWLARTDPLSSVRILWRKSSFALSKHIRTTRDVPSLKDG